MTRHQILRLDSSIQGSQSQTNRATDYITSRLMALDSNDIVRHRDFGVEPLPDLSPSQLSVIHGSLEPSDAEQATRLELSEALIAELFATKYLVIGAPVYNFGIPTSLKVWIDYICRARKTFRYSEKGPEGLTGVEHAFIVVASGGTPVGSEYEFVSHYLKHIMNFIGVKHIHVIDAGGSKAAMGDNFAHAKQQIDQLLAVLQVEAAVA